MAPLAAGAVPLPHRIGHVAALAGYGLRLWAAVCLALLAAFWLQMEEPSWAGTTAAAVCQPAVGAALRKGWFRILGTLAGAWMALALAAAFADSREGFLLGLALWGAACGFASVVLPNFASYGAALAGLTTAVIAADLLGAVGGVGHGAFNLATARASEIGIGVAATALVLGATGAAQSRRRLADTLAGLAAEIGRGAQRALAIEGPEPAETRAARRELLRRLVGVGPVLDEARGEISGLRFDAAILRRAAGGLFQALSAWRSLAAELGRVPAGAAEAAGLLRLLPSDLGAVIRLGGSATPPELQRARAACADAARRLLALPAQTPSLRLVADQAALGLLGLRRALGGALFITGADGAAGRGRARRAPREPLPDLLPAAVAALRAFATIGLAELLWLATGWPNGAICIAFAAVAVLIFAPAGDLAIGFARHFALGTAAAAVLAGVIAFLLLPQLSGPEGLCGALALVLIPAGALSIQGWMPRVFLGVTGNFVPLLGPANPMTYDPAAFFNTAAALLAGLGLAMLGTHLVPHPSPGLRARRLLALTLRDLRRLAAGALAPSHAAWEARVQARLVAMPNTAEPVQYARLAAALAVGHCVIALRGAGRRIPDPGAAEAMLGALAAGDAAGAARWLAELDRILAGQSGAAHAPQDQAPGLLEERHRLRTRAAILVAAAALDRHVAYFGAPERP
jgi:uncharacterized membrane protein YccC